MPVNEVSRQAEGEMLIQSISSQSMAVWQLRTLEKIKKVWMRWEQELQEREML